MMINIRVTYAEVLLRAHLVVGPGERQAARCGVAVLHEGGQQRHARLRDRHVSARVVPSATGAH